MVPIDFRDGTDQVSCRGGDVICWALKISEAEIPPEQYQDMDCDALNAERTRLLAVRADLDTPLRSNTDAQREAELTQVNGKLYTIAKAQSDKSCRLVASAPPSSVVR